MAGLKFLPPPIKTQIITPDTGELTKVWLDWFYRLNKALIDFEVFTESDDSTALLGSFLQAVEQVEALARSFENNASAYHQIEALNRQFEGQASLYNRIEDLEKELAFIDTHKPPSLPFYLGKAVSIDVDGNLVITGGLTVETYIRHIQIPVIAAGNPASQPTPVEVGTAAGYQFASSGVQEELHFQWEIPVDWTGGDMTVEIDWVPNSGAMTNPHAVKWTFEYYSVAEGETIDNGTIATQSVTYDTTTAQNLIVHSPVTIPYNDANQPLTVGDHIFVRCFRDTTVTDDFPGTVVATAFEIIYNSNSIPTGN